MRTSFDRDVNPPLLSGGITCAAAMDTRFLETGCAMALRARELCGRRFGVVAGRDEILSPECGSFRFSPYNTSRNLGRGYLASCPVRLRNNTCFCTANITRSRGSR